MAVDRALGAVCVACTAAVAAFALVAGASAAPPPLSIEQAFGEEDLGPVDDPETTAAFLDSFTRAEQGAWVLDADWERSRGAEVVLDSRWHQVQDASGNQLVSALGALSGTYDGRVVQCGPVEGGRECDAVLAPDPRLVFDRSTEVAAEMTTPHTGAYTVARAPERTILGERTDCFLVRRRPGAAARVFGAETTYCYSRDAIPLLVERREGAVVDTRTATATSLDVGPADFEALVEPWADVLARADLRSAP